MVGRRAELARRAGTIALAVLLGIALGACGKRAPAQDGGNGFTCQPSNDLVRAVEDAAARKPRTNSQFAADTQQAERLMAIYAAAWDSIDDVNRDPAFGVGVLAAIHSVESSFGDGRVAKIEGPPTRYGRAQGPMQFLEDTWYGRGRDMTNIAPNGYGADGNGDGRADPQDLHDAIFGSAKYVATLLKNAKGDWNKAIWGYNHSTDYVNLVLSRARKYQGVCQRTSNIVLASGGTQGECGTERVPGRTARLEGGIVIPPTNAPEPVVRMICAANRVAHLKYFWGGGHPTRAQIDTRGYDCSGLTMYVLREAGYLKERAQMVADNFEDWGEPATEDDWVRIYTNRRRGRPAGHVYMVIAGVRLDAEDSSRVGPAWRATAANRHPGFNAPRRPPGLGAPSRGGSDARA